MFDATDVVRMAADEWRGSAIEDGRCSLLFPAERHDESAVDRAVVAVVRFARKWIVCD